MEEYDDEDCVLEVPAQLPLTQQILRSARETTIKLFKQGRSTREIVMHLNKSELSCYGCFNASQIMRWIHFRDVIW